MVLAHIKAENIWEITFDLLDKVLEKSRFSAYLLFASVVYVPEGIDVLWLLGVKLLNASKIWREKERRDSNSVIRFRLII